MMDENQKLIQKRLSSKRDDAEEEKTIRDANSKGSFVSKYDLFSSFTQNDAPKNGKNNIKIGGFDPKNIDKLKQALELIDKRGSHSPNANLYNVNNQHYSHTNNNNHPARN